MPRRVCIPIEVQCEIDASDLRDAEKTVIYWLVLRCGTHRSRCCGLHQRTIDLAIGQRSRIRIVKFIRGSQYIRKACGGSYVIGQRCLRYEIVGVDSLPDSMEDSAHPKSEVLSGGYWTGPVTWRMVDFGPLMEAIQGARLQMGWEKSKQDAEWSLSQLDEPTVTEEEVVESCESDVQADAHVQSYRRFCERRTDEVFRKDGRVYHSVTSLPRGIRRRVMRFGGIAADHLDISSCYPWILAAEHRKRCIAHGLSTDKVDQLLDLIDSGQFYARIAELAGITIESEDDLRKVKRDFQRCCLFGRIGRHRLWFALKTLCPGVCQDIQWWRSQMGGATRLAHVLQRAEGALMTDGVVCWLVSRSVPAVQIHDGVYVPAGYGDVARDYLLERSRQLYGRECHVKLTAS